MEARFSALPRTLIREVSEVDEGSDFGGGLGVDAEDELGEGAVLVQSEKGLLLPLLPPLSPPPVIASGVLLLRLDSIRGYGDYRNESS